MRKISARVIEEASRFKIRIVPPGLKALQLDSNGAELSEFRNLIWSGNPKSNKRREASEWKLPS
jgi:hypothetical protein